MTLIIKLGFWSRNSQVCIRSVDNVMKNFLFLGFNFCVKIISKSFALNMLHGSKYRFLTFKIFVFHTLIIKFSYNLIFKLSYTNHVLMKSLSMNVIFVVVFLLGTKINLFKTQ